ncbi:efflux RND transporter periplasmic adaptor subunit [Arcobacter defluvii]|uniref:RND family efflux system, membrane fusion protein n=1 Tax=Arcobacter defluvii TaxID=873191 RepID=A0AAE7E8B4_9BACT|nr:efflux RND transporter periplasmic adaptor subunit [Arcobacter defluvii]QKF78909.1 RND family efflux system, membrane fusion protein [Arcobacter defluvii]RXI30745.1 efflux transporter periplasmic adaptor subunit [Arcobacter defluvii]
MIKISKLSFFILTILFILSGCEEKNSQSAQTKQSIEVGTITIKEQPIALQQELSGRVKAKLVSEVRPQINGIIEKQLFIEGSKVTQGDILYQIDSSSYEAIYNQEKAALQSAKATLQSAKLKSQRYDELLKVDGISKQETDDAKASYLEALALVEEKKAALESAKINLERTKIKAPISGYIGISTITQGALVSANQTTALTTIRDTNTVYVDLNQSQTQLLALKKLLTKKNIKEGNTNVSLILSDETLYSHKGTLQLQEVSVDENTGSVTLRAIFPNDENILLPGMFVKATIEGAIDTKAFLLPQQAVSRDEKANPIITVVQDDNSIKRRQITIERAIGNKWVVTSGINNNDKIIIEGLNKINMKSKVNPIDVTNKYIQED